MAKFNIKISLFGITCLENRNGKIIYLENSKDMAILAYLSRQEGQIATRERLTEIFWGGADIKKRQASLRQSVKRLRQLEASSGTKFLKIDNRRIGFVHGTVRTDVDDIHDALSNLVDHSIAKASRLYSGNFLTTVNTQTMSSSFETWRQTQFQSIRNSLIERAANLLSQLTDPSSKCWVGLARFLLKIDSTYEWAHQCLIRHFHSVGRADRAKRQFQDCKSLLLGSLGNSPSKETLELANGAVRTKSETLERSWQLRPPPLSRSDLFPTIVVVPEDNASERDFKPDILSEISEQIVRSREFVLKFGSAYGQKEVSDLQQIGVDHEVGGQFSLLVQERQSTSKAIIELKERSSGKSIFIDTIPVSRSLNYEDRARRIARSLDVMQSRIRNYYQKSRALSSSSYRDLSTVYELMKKFDRRANESALEILSRIEKQNGVSSMVYAFKASIYLKQRLFLESVADADRLVQEAHDLAAKALSLDPWHSMNHRYIGFAACYSGSQADARNHLLFGHSLTPLDPQQTIASAEICAFADDVRTAKLLQSNLTKSGKDIPRYFYGYMANIEFAAGNFEEAAQLAAMAPKESMDYRATRIAALWDLGQKDAAKMELEASVRYLAAQNGETPRIDRVCEWLGDLNPFVNQRTKGIYRQGLQGAATLL